MEKIFFIFMSYFILKYFLLMIFISTGRDKTLLEIILEIIATVFIYLNIQRPLVTTIIVLTDFLITNLFIYFNVIVLKHIAFKVLISITHNGFISKVFCVVFNKKRFAKKMRFIQQINYGPKLKQGIPAMAKKTHKKTKVKFDGKGFPKFKSIYTIYLKKEDYKKSRDSHFNYANKKVYQKALSSKAVRKLFTKKELEQMKNGVTPDKYTWHHHQNKGKLQLVSRKIHSEVNHIGGYSIWCGE